MGDIKVYNLDQFGVVVDTNPLNSPPGELTKAQNAIADPLGEIGSIRKRPGLKKFISSAGSGTVRGGTSIPIDLGSAGPDFQNPFTDSPVSAVNFTRPSFVLQGLSIPRFSDDSDIVLPDFTDFTDFGPFPDDWDTDVFDEAADELASEEAFVNESPTERQADAIRDANIEVADQPEDVAEFNDVFNSPEAPTGYPGDVNAGNGLDGQAGVASPLTTNASSTLYALTVVGSDANWYVGLNSTLTEHFDNGTSFPNPATLLFPTQALRAASTLSDWTTGGSTSALRGRTMTVLNGAIVYVQS